MTLILFRPFTPPKPRRTKLVRSRAQERIAARYESRRMAVDALYGAGTHETVTRALDDLYPSGDTPQGSEGDENASGALQPHGHEEPAILA